MMKTRRKSKAAAAAAADAEEHSSPAHDEPHSFTVSIPDDIDQDALSNLLPDTTLATPSQDLIISLYRLLLSQAADVDATQRDLDEARGESERKDVELDQALQDKESVSKDLEATIEALHEELKQVKHERDQLGKYPVHYLPLFDAIFL